MQELYEFNDSDKRIVKKSRIENFELSTVFLGLDHNHSDSGPPLLFETMFFQDYFSMTYSILYRYVHYHTALSHHNRLWKMIEYMITTEMENLPPYVNNNDFRGELALFRLKRGY
jgi:hypothetical protein